ncbi:hypothetical protein [Metallosphaera hakonensis]|nr:hypothetical protein [Metallosphaera hakonensis]
MIKLNPIQTQFVIKLVVMGAMATSLLLAAHGIVIHAGLSDTDGGSV